MENRYKITLSSNTVYKEIELAPDAHQVKVGTGVDCDVRLHKELFFGQIELLFVKNGCEWSVHCSDNLYLTVGDIRKLMTKNLKHGDTLEVKYQDSDILVFTMDFLIDFDNGKIRYERTIDIGSTGVITIGTSANSNIVLSGEYVKDDALVLSRKHNGFILDIKKTTYGVYINGNKAKEQALIRNGDFLSVSDYFFYFKDNKIWTQIRPDMKLNSLSYVDCPINESYPKFNRNTRIKTVINEEQIQILDPPAKPQKPKNNLFMRLLPSLGMLLAAGVMAFLGGPMLIIMSGISGTMAIITTILSIKEGKKEFKENSAQRIEKYNAYVEKKKSEIEECRKKELKELEEIFVSQSVEKDRFESFSANLFDRSKEDKDYLCVRLGNGDVVSKRVVNYKKQEKLDVEDDLQLIPEQICEEYKNVHNAPIVCDLKDINALGVVGAPISRFELLKNIVVDIAARQYFTDVKMMFVVEKKHKEKVHWLRHLPHVYNDDIGVRNIVCDDESKNLIFEYLYKELTIREQNKSYKENIVVFFYDEYGFKSHPVSKFIDKAKELGVTFVFFGDTVADVPQGCNYIVSLLDTKNATIVNAHNKSENSKFVYPNIETAQAERIVQLLAPVYTEEISLEGTLTKNISMFELLNILAVDDIDLGSRWATSQVFKSMSAPLGVSKTGVVSLDLHDKAHGPHGLVAGTTGSGKSEILQTYILAMSTLFHPYEVGFVIIDFKGGGMVNQFKDLPHLLGAITNIDGKEINRSLKSIKAELQKRQRLFAEADVNHIDKYIKKYKAGEASTPLPHLIIIVDEFAELKAEQPEFMKELISAARIGRSLGVHLILATQKPSGQVDDQIWSNSRFKLCLKVQSKQDSNEVLKSPLAAEIKEPGRAYLQVGNNEIFELFQSAYSGASEKSDDSNVKEFEIYRLTDSGRKQPVYVQKKKKSKENSKTQLDAIVEYVADYCSSTYLSKLPDICLPPLSECIDFTTQSSGDDNGQEYSIAIGVYDDPDNQYQGEYSINLTEQNVMIVGSSQSGKTNVLQTIIRALATKFTPEEVNIYIMDFASMVLKNFETLRHVGGVVTASEDEKLKNLVKLLLTEIEVRKEKIMSAGVSSFNAYREAGNTDLAHIVLLVDNLTVGRELYFSEDDVLLNICREGLSVGISVVIANSSTNGIGFRYLSNFNCKIALFCNDKSEYYSLFDHCRETLSDIHGRSLVEIDKTHYECQMYLSFEGEKEFERVRTIKEFIDDINTQYPDSKAKLIPVIPEFLSCEYVYSNFTREMRENSTVVVGLDYATVSPLTIALNNLGVCGISGCDNAISNVFTKYLLGCLAEKHTDENELYIYDSISKDLAEFKNKDYVAEYGVMGEEACEAMFRIEEKLAVRYNMVANGDETALEKEKLIVIVLNSPDIVGAICSNSKALASYNNITGKYKNLKVCVLLGNIDNKAISYNSPEIYRVIRDNKKLFFFGDISRMKIFDVPIAYARQYKKRIGSGDCYYINDENIYKLKTVQDFTL